MPIYEKAVEKTIEKYQDMADQDAKGVQGFESLVLVKIGLGVIPQFDDL